MAEISAEEKVGLYSAAIIEALAVAGSEVGDPDINAAIAALTHAQGYLIAKITDRNARRQAERRAVEWLGEYIAAEVNARIVREQVEGRMQ